MINLLLFLIVGVFLSSQPVGRTLDYLAGRLGVGVMKLATIALPLHLIKILEPIGRSATAN